jgi:hypothetical protein
VRLPAVFLTLSLSLLTVSAVPAEPAAAITVCADGWISNSTGSGTCSWHGGIMKGGYLPNSIWVPSWPTRAPKPKRLVVKSYKTCSSLLKDYSKGVADKQKSVSAMGNLLEKAPFVNSSLYAMNKKLDPEKNGIACEKIWHKGAISNAARIGEPVRGKWARFEYRLLALPKINNEAACSRVPRMFDSPLKGCLFERDKNGNPVSALGPDPLYSMNWVEVSVSALRLPAQLNYGFSQYDFAFYKPGASGVYAWTEHDEKTLVSPSTAIYSPFAMGEERSITFFIAVPKEHDVSELVFYLREIVDPERNLYYFPLE